MWESAGLSGQGGREYNEDCFGIETLPDCGLVIVADGLGGHGGGQIASQTAVRRISEEFLDKNGRKPDKDWLAEVFEQANRAVLEQQKESCRMKTTCVALTLDGPDAYWAHVGDSRLYHFADGALVFCTTDHSVSQMAVFAGEITKDQIRFHEDRNRVLRALGTPGRLRPDFGRTRLDSGGFHAFLLCTDGFWEYVLETEMEIDLAKAERPEEWISFMTGRLKLRTEGKENDNYTAAAVFVYADGGRPESQVRSAVQTGGEGEKCSLYDAKPNCEVEV